MFLQESLMRVRSKLLTGFLLVAFFALLVGIGGLFFQYKIGESGLDIGTKHAPLGDAAMEIKLTATTAHLFYKEIITGDFKEDIETVWSLLNETQWYIDAILSGGTNDEGTFIATEDSEIISIMEMVKSDLSLFTEIAKKRYTSLKDLSINGSGLYQEQTVPETDVDIQFEQAFEDLIEKADTAEEIIHDSMNEQIELLRRNLIYSEFILAGLLVLTFIFAMVLSFILARGIANPLKQFQLLFNRGAEGDLSVRSSNRNKDEIGDLSSRFNDFIGKLGGTISGIKSSAEKVENIKDSLSSSAEETAASIANIKNGTTSLLEESKKMDENVSENVASIEEITANINSIQDQINEQVAMVEESTAAITEMIASLQNVDGITRKKTESVLRLVAAIEGGNNASNETDIKFQIDVIDKIDGISDMADSIQAIAAQTNLLSMNAAIEAAHAGDAGKGFAVVADEIRKLADTASKSSSEITKTIKEIADGIEGTGVVAQKKKDAFVIMNQEIKETKNAFDEIATSVHELNSGGTQVQEAMVILQDVSSNIKNAASEMTVGAEHVIRGQLGLKDISENISRGMLEINSGTEEIVIASDELVGYASELNEVVSGLKEETGKFTI